MSITAQKTDIQNKFECEDLVTGLTDRFKLLSEMYQNDKEFYKHEALLTTEGIQRIFRELESRFNLSDVITNQYRYVARLYLDGFNGRLGGEPATIGTIIKEVSMSLDKIEHKKVLLDNIVKDSLIFCFKENMTDAQFFKHADKVFNDIENDTKELPSLLLAGIKKIEQIQKEKEISGIPDDNVKELADVMKVSLDKKENAWKNHFRNMFPGTGTQDTVTLTINHNEPHTITGEYRKYVNRILPTNKKKSNMVDWENKSVSGYVRELDTHRQMFTIYNSLQSDAEQLLRLHYEEADRDGNLADYIKSHKKEKFIFRSERNKYILNS